MVAEHEHSEPLSDHAAAVAAMFRDGQGLEKVRRREPCLLIVPSVGSVGPCWNPFQHNGPGGFTESCTHLSDGEKVAKAASSPSPFIDGSVRG